MTVGLFCLEGKMQVLRLRELLKLSGLSKSTIYARIKEGDFPKPIRLGPRSIGWFQHDIESWLESRRQE
ncbi:helix-turn-helix transcriptional regulator [Leptospirillum ferriphilum]|uniref:helix-turn-helix transcriptional regulator n=1 Tax=Leptospirillum ferriphilum TaxID=178606 RepID=UPI003CC80076